MSASLQIYSGAVAGSTIYGFTCHDCYLLHAWCILVSGIYDVYNSSDAIPGWYYLYQMCSSFLFPLFFVILQLYCCHHASITSPTSNLGLLAVHKRSHKRSEYTWWYQLATSTQITSILFIQRLEAEAFTMQHQYHDFFQESRALNQLPCITPHGCVYVHAVLLTSSDVMVCI